MRKILMSLLVGALVTVGVGLAENGNFAWAEDCVDVKFVYLRGSGSEVETNDNYQTFKNTLETRMRQTKLSYEFEDLNYPAVGVGKDNLGVTLGAYFGAGESYEFGNSVKKGREMLKEEISSSCKKTKFVIAGYSQGAMAVSGALQDINPEKVIYAATIGDPKIYLPEGKGIYPAACRNKNLSEYRIYVPDCRAYEGLLGSFQPYQPSGFEGRVGTWCNKKDVFCSSHFSIDSHTSYVADGIYDDIARVIFSKIVMAMSADSGGDAARNGVLHQVAIILDGAEVSETVKEQMVKEAKKLAKQSLENGDQVAIYVYEKRESGNEAEAKDGDSGDKQNETDDDYGYPEIECLGECEIIRYTNERGEKVTCVDGACVAVAPAKNDSDEEAKTIGATLEAHKEWQLTKKCDFSSCTEEKVEEEIETFWKTTTGSAGAGTTLEALATVLKENDWQKGANKSVALFTGEKLGTNAGFSIEETARISAAIDPVNIYVVGGENVESYKGLAQLTDGGLVNLEEESSGEGYIAAGGLTEKIMKRTDSLEKVIVEDAKGRTIFETSFEGVGLNGMLELKPSLTITDVKVDGRAATVSFSHNGNKVLVFLNDYFVGMTSEKELIADELDRTRENVIRLVPVNDDYRGEGAEVTIPATNETDETTNGDDGADTSGLDAEREAEQMETGRDTKRSKYGFFVKAPNTGGR